MFTTNNIAWHKVLFKIKLNENNLADNDNNKLVIVHFFIAFVFSTDSLHIVKQPLLLRFNSRMGTQLASETHLKLIQRPKVFREKFAREK